MQATARAGRASRPPERPRAAGCRGSRYRSGRLRGCRQWRATCSRGWRSTRTPRQRSASRACRHYECIGKGRNHGVVYVPIVPEYFARRTHRAGKETDIHIGSSIGPAPLQATTSVCSGQQCELQKLRVPGRLNKNTWNNTYTPKRKENLTSCRLQCTLRRTPRTNATAAAARSPATRSRQAHRRWAHRSPAAGERRRSAGQGTAKGEHSNEKVWSFAR